MTDEQEAALNAAIVEARLAVSAGDPHGVAANLFIEAANRAGVDSGEAVAFLIAALCGAAQIMGQLETALKHAARTQTSE